MSGMEMVPRRSADRLAVWVEHGLLVPAIELAPQEARPVFLRQARMAPPRCRPAARPCFFSEQAHWPDAALPAADVPPSLASSAPSAAASALPFSAGSPASLSPSPPESSGPPPLASSSAALLTGLSLRAFFLGGPESAAGGLRHGSVARALQHEIVPGSAAPAAR